jgi:uncharacterized protein YbjT (DUF2867 family)
MILLIGASGTVGGHLLPQLTITGHPFRALVRNPTTAHLVERYGGEAALGDLDEPDTVAAAMVGVQTAFLLCPFDESALTRTRTFVTQAQQAGVRRVVRMSAMGAVNGPDLPIARAQRDAEELLEGSGLAWSHLRPNTFMTNLLFSVASIVDDGALYVPAGDGAISFVDPADVAAVTAQVLTNDGHDGRAYEITGPAALDHDQVAAIMAAAAGHPVRYVDTPEDAAGKAMADQGLSAWYVDRILGFYRELRTNTFWATVTPTVELLTGRRARPLHEWAAAHAAAFRRD